MADYPSSLERRIDRLGEPFANFIRAQTTASLVLLACTLAALIWANSDGVQVYRGLVSTPVGLSFGEFRFEAHLRHWINDGLMVLFFFLIGLEIKREILAGDLRQPRQRHMLVLGAVGGMLVPALIFAAFNAGGEAAAGWGVPIATDTAFALGVLAALRRHIPRALVAFVVGLAIVDDIGAILVIAIFYTEAVAIGPLLAALALTGLLGFANYAGFRRPEIYIIGGLCTWYAMLISGVHATLAGVLVALTVPARPKLAPRRLLRRARGAIDRIERNHEPIDVLGDEQQHGLIQDVKDYAERASTPLRRWEDALELPVALLILPGFALVNAGIPISGAGLAQVLTEPLGLGVVLGLVLGKFVGISGACWLAQRLGLGRLPGQVRMVHVVGASLIGGMGFTMSTFVATLAFGSRQALLDEAKVGILLASLCAALLGATVLYLIGRRQRQAAQAQPRAPRMAAADG